MFTKQNIIHITLDVLLITVLFIYVNNKNKSLNDSVEQLREYTEEQVDNLNTKIDKVIKYVTKTPPAQPQVNYQRRPPQREEPDYISTNPTPQTPQKRQAPVSKSSQADKQSKKVRFEEEVKQAPPRQYTEDIPMEEVDAEKTEKNEVEDFISSINPSFNISNILPQMNPMHFHMRPNVAAFVSTSQLIGNARAPQRQESNKIEIIEEESSNELENNEENFRERENDTDLENKKEEEERLDDLDILEIEKAIGLKGE